MNNGRNQDMAKDQPWLYAELHVKKDMEEVIREIFRLPVLPEVERAQVREAMESASRGLMGYLFVHVHQAERFLKLHKISAIPSGLAAWDLGEEAVHELLVSYLLARIGAVPRSLPHLRRSLELVVEGTFLSVSFLTSSGGAWNPFSVLYLSDMWQHFAARSPIRARDVIESLRQEGRDVTKTFQAFSEFYMDRFVSTYCDQHLHEHETNLKRQGFPLLLSDRLPVGEQAACHQLDCRGLATKRVLERVPDFDLMREVVKAKLKGSGYSNNDDKLLKDIHARTSGFVHVTREAHRHSPGWEENEVRAWAKIMHDLLAWMARTLSLLWQYHGSELPGLRALLESWHYDFASKSWGDDVVKHEVCELFLATGRG